MTSLKFETVKVSLISYYKHSVQPKISTYGTVQTHLMSVKTYQIMFKNYTLSGFSEYSYQVRLAILLFPCGIRLIFCVTDA
jgi:hypothetical protein